MKYRELPRELKMRPRFKSKMKLSTKVMMSGKDKARTRHEMKRAFHRYRQELDLY